MVRLGIIGCGSIVRFRHAPEAAINPDVEITGFYDLKTERAQKMVDQYGGKVYQTYLDMLEDPEVDAVCVCTTNATHAQISIQALKNKKHVLCEKPMATRVSDAEEMIRAARENQKLLMVGLSQRLDFVHQEVKKLLDSGEAGEILSFHTTFGHAGPERWGVEKGTSSWFFHKDLSSTGAIGDIGVHKIDLLRWFVGKEITSVQAKLCTLDKRYDNGELVDVDDNAMCILTFENGVCGTMRASWTHYGEDEHATILYCTKGIVQVYTSLTHPIILVKKNGNKQLFQFREEIPENGIKPSGVLDGFVDSIQTGQPLSVTGEDGLAVLKVVEACMESSETGRMVMVK